MFPLKKIFLIIENLKSNKFFLTHKKMFVSRFFSVFDIRFVFMFVFVISREIFDFFCFSNVDARQNSIDLKRTEFNHICSRPAIIRVFFYFMIVGNESEFHQN